MPKFPAYPNMGRHIRPYPIAAAQTFLEGAVLTLNASGEAAEGGADPTPILGIALHDAGADPDTTTILVAVATDQATFIFQHDTTAPVQADEGDNFGLLKDVDGVWVLRDFVTAGLERVVVEKVYIDREQYEVKVLEAHRHIS